MESYQHHTKKQAVIVLIEKKVRDRHQIKNWRPIPLNSVDVKIGTIKVIAKRMESSNYLGERYNNFDVVFYGFGKYQLVNGSNRFTERLLLSLLEFSSKTS